MLCRGTMARKESRRTPRPSLRVINNSSHLSQKHMPLSLSILRYKCNKNVTKNQLRETRFLASTFAVTRNGDTQNAERINGLYRLNAPLSNLGFTKPPFSDNPNLNKIQSCSIFQSFGVTTLYVCISLPEDLDISRPT